MYNTYKIISTKGTLILVTKRNRGLRSKESLLAARQAGTLRETKRTLRWS